MHHHHHHHHRDHGDDSAVAIIGMSCKFAGNATDPEKLWKMIAEKRSGWSQIPSSRFHPSSTSQANQQKGDNKHVQGGHFLEEDVALFDASAFNLTVETASMLDPQYRLQLECVYEALENAGLPLKDVAGTRASVFSGVFFHDYSDGMTRDTDNLPRQWMVGTDTAMASNRISHFFDLRGPSMTLNSGCSTSLVALHLAVQSLKNKEADMAVVGGSSLLLHADAFKALGSLGVLSPDGRSYTFDSRANGYGRGEGVAVVILKRLPDATRSHDPIRAIIRATMLNQDGKTETITSPSQDAQATLIRDCYAAAQIDPADTQYFEAHGTGTKVGDTIEAQSIASVFRPHRDADSPLYIGSVKTNIGHTEGASGLASLIKVVLAMEKGLIPPNTNFEKVNPATLLDDQYLKIAKDLINWPLPKEGFRRASINNFGYGGTNAHVIIESADVATCDVDEKVTSEDSMRRHLFSERSSCNDGTKVVDDNVDKSRYGSGANNDIIDKIGTSSINGVAGEINVGVSQGQLEDHDPILTVHASDKHQGSSSVEVSFRETRLLAISARSEDACLTMLKNLCDFLSNTRSSNEQQFIESLVFTLGNRRTVFPWIAAYPISITNGIPSVIKSLESSAFTPKCAPHHPRLGMVFTGQGAQWYAMGKELLEAYPVFKVSIQESDAHLRVLGTDWTLTGELGRSSESTRVHDAGVSIPICVGVQIALVHLLRSWGVKPSAITGHSSGEIAAAYAVGAISHHAAMALAYHRSVLTEAHLESSSTRRSGMVAVGLHFRDVELDFKDLIREGRVVVACVNSPSSTTISGDLNAIHEVEANAQRRGILTRQLRVPIGYHSHHMNAIASQYREAVRDVLAKESGQAWSDSVVFSSSVTGDRVFEADELANPEHWVRSLLQPVQFVDALTNMVGSGHVVSSSGSAVDIILEVGPHTALGGSIQEILQTLDSDGVQTPYFGTLVRNQDARESMHKLAGNLLRQGLEVDIGAVNFPAEIPAHVRVLTDLPLHPWNHSTRHWFESRLNKALRDRGYTMNGLLGYRVPGTDPASPWWRLQLNASTVPWLREHLVQSKMMYPVAGMICMALQAMAELAASEIDSLAQPTIVSGYRVRTFKILTALIVPDTASGIEVQVHLRPCNDQSIKFAGWKQFELFSVTSDSRWTRHATGFISADYNSKHDADAWVRANHDEKIKGYKRHISPNDIYGGLKSVGISHGPVFRNISRAFQDSKSQTSICEIGVSEHAISSEGIPDLMIHPTTLDSVFVAAYVARPGAEIDHFAPEVPVQFDDMWVSTNIKASQQSDAEAYSIVSYADAAGFVANISLRGTHAAETLQRDSLFMTIEGLHFKSIGQSSSSSATQGFGEDICSQITWRPDITLASKAMIDIMREELKHAVDPKEIEMTTELMRICIYYMEDAISQVTEPSFAARVSGHYAKYYSWMQGQVQAAKAGLLRPNSASWTSDDTYERSRRIELATRSSYTGELICRIGVALPSILRNDITLLELMKQDDLLNRYYRDIPQVPRIASQASALLRHLCHKNPRARILEIGAGTGGMTRIMLSTLGTPESGGPYAAFYHFTDISSGFFEAARSEFSPWSDIMGFDRLDIEQDVAGQGFIPHSYDIVIAAQVLHATKSMINTMANVRSLLKTGGSLLINEVVQDQMPAQFINGLFSGWWVGEEPERQNSPSMSVEAWERLLNASDFTGIDIGIRDCENDDAFSCYTALSTATSHRHTPDLSSGGIDIITSDTILPSSTWTAAIQDALSTANNPRPILTIRTLSSISTITDMTTATTTNPSTTCVFVAELNSPILYNLTASDLVAIKSLLARYTSVLWLTRGGAVEGRKPAMSLAAGLLRSLRCEHVGRRYMSLDLDPDEEAAAWSVASACTVARILTLQSNYFGSVVDSSLLDAAPSDDFEFAERKGVLLVPRFHSVPVLNAAVAPSARMDENPSLGNMTTRNVVEQISIEALKHRLDGRRPIALRVRIPGSLDMLAFGEDQRQSSIDIQRGAEVSLAEDCVEVEPRAFGVNFRDVMVAMGQLKDRYMGVECAGVVTAVGQAAARAGGFAIGDRVACLVRGSYNVTQARTEWTNAIRLPASLSFEEAASLPVVFSTAYTCLTEIARLRKGQSVLIHAAAGGVGQAAIQVAQHLGAQVLATVGSASKRDLLMEKYGIPANCIFHSRNQSFSTEILTATNGRGVDVVLNSLAGSLLQASFDLVADKRSCTLMSVIIIIVILLSSRYKF